MNHWLFVGLVVLHVFVCLILVLLILVQNDKGGGLAGAFGGMGGSAAFSGSSASTFLTTLTRWVAAISFAILIGLNVMSTKGIESGRRESELKGARKGLSSVLPSSGLPSGAGAAGGPANAIPGLGTVPEKGGAPGSEAPGTAAPAKGQ
jgi:preprotein translocase subunit SecG